MKNKMKNLVLALMILTLFACEKETIIQPIYYVIQDTLDTIPIDTIPVDTVPEILCYTCTHHHWIRQGMHLQDGSTTWINMGDWTWSVQYCGTDEQVTNYEIVNSRDTISSTYENNYNCNCIEN